MSENKNGLLASLRKDLEEELEKLKKEKMEERKKYENETKEVIKKELAEITKKNAEQINNLESKLKKIYYWLFGIVLICLVINGGMFFYFKKS